jgi:hypothetical protein
MQSVSRNDKIQDYSLAENFGPLVSRVPETEWLKEVESFSDKLITKKKDKKRDLDSFIPDCMLTHTRLHDREAGDDDSVSFREQKDQVVFDTKLLKGNTSNGFAAIRLAGPDTLIDMIETNKLIKDDRFWGEIIIRIQYLAPTLSVKKIRLLLRGLADAKLDMKDLEAKKMIEAIGEEILCRYHCLTLWSCCSIAESLSLLDMCHRGTLNVIALAWKQQLDEHQGDVIPSERVIDMAIRILSAFSKLGYTPPIIIESVVESLSKDSGRLTAEQRLNAIQTIFNIRPEILQSESCTGLMTFSSGEIDAMSPALALSLIKIAAVLSHPSMTTLARKLVSERIVVAEDGCQMVIKETKGLDQFGNKRFNQHLMPCNLEILTILRGFVEENTPQGFLIDQILNSS